MVTIILLVSRAKYLSRVFAQLEFLTCNREETNLLTYVDGDLQLYVETRNLTELSKFNQRLCVYRKKGQPNVGSVTRRRQRIADIHNEIKAELGNSEFVFIVEDDTLIPANALEKLMRVAAGRRDVGIVSGVELGRWGYKHIGAWVVDDVYEPQLIKSVALGEGVQRVDATGMYCCLVKTDHYFKHHFKPMQSVGPDVQFGLALRQQGYKNYVDYSVQCTHMTLKEDLTIQGSNIDIVVLEKIGDKWAQGAEVQDGR